MTVQSDMEVVEMTVREMELVGVYRQCRECGEWKLRERFPFGGRKSLTHHRPPRVCNVCCRGKQPPSFPRSIARARSIVLTDSGRTLLREMGA